MAAGVANSTRGLRHLMSTKEAAPFADVGKTLADLLCLPQPDQPPESKRGYLSARVVRGVAELVDRSGLFDRLDEWRLEDNPLHGKQGGRPTSTDERTCFVVLLALIVAGEPPLVTRVAEAYSKRLQTTSRDLLNLPRIQVGSDKAIYARVYRALRRILAVVDPYPGPRRTRLTRTELEKLTASWNLQDVETRQRRLVTLTNALLETSIQLLPDDIRRNWLGNICIDATLVRVWGKAGSPSVQKSKDCSSDKMSPEHLAGWYARSDDHREPDTLARGSKGKGKYAWGYEAHLAVMTANDPETDPNFPLLVLGMSFDKPAGRVAENAVTAIQSIIDRGHPAGICAGDRAYFPNSKPEKFQLPVRALGYTLCGDYRDDQLGIQAEHGGALLVEGNWYCPSIPQPLIDATKDHREKRISENVYTQRIKQRTRYLFRPKHRPDASGHTAHMCPARGPGATARCPLAPNPGPVTLGLPTTRTQVLSPPSDPDICCTNTTSITFPTAPDPTVTPSPTSVAKYRQDLQYKSPQWRRTYTTLRNTIEGFNGFTKSPTDEDLEQPARRRVRGYAFQALLVACLITASNLRKVGAYLRKREHSARPPAGPKASRRPAKSSNLADYRPEPNGPPQALPISA